MNYDARPAWAAHDHARARRFEQTGQVPRPNLFERPQTHESDDWQRAGHYSSWPDPDSRADSQAQGPPHQMPHDYG
jgi:hypothetical protein